MIGEHVDAASARTRQDLSSLHLLASHLGNLALALYLGKLSESAVSHAHHIRTWSGQTEEALEIFFWLNGQQIPFGVNLVRTAVVNKQQWWWRV